MEHKDDKIQRACSTSISTDAGEPETPKEAMTRPNGHLWKMSTISEVNKILPRKAWIPTKRCVVKPKGKKPVPVKWVFKSKEEADSLIRLNLRNVVKGYMQVTGFAFTELFYPVTSETSTRVPIRFTTYNEDDGWIADICDVEAALLHPNMEVNMYIE